jgi:predicted ArsR family transcriptional regulator
MQRGNKKMKRTHQERGIMIDFNGERLHISEWAKRLGISRAAMRSRLDSWPLEDALTRPKGAFGPKPTSPKQYR